MLPLDVKTYRWRMQHACFKTLPIQSFIPFIKKYFEPSDLVNRLVLNFEIEHSIDYSNTAAIYYRGTDKHTESHVAPYELFISKAEEILSQNPDVRFLIQTDETEFKEAFLERFPNNSFFNEMLPTIPRNTKIGMHLLYKGLENADNNHYVKPEEASICGARFFAMVLAMAKCKWLVIPTSNASLWAVFCRGNFDGVFQMLNGKWIS